MTELIDSFNLLRKTLQGFEINDSKLEPQSSSHNEEAGSADPDQDVQSGTLSREENSPGPSLVQLRSVHELESILIFDLCALSEIATSKSAILRVRGSKILSIFLVTKCIYTSFSCHSDNVVKQQDCTTLCYT